MPVPNFHFSSAFIPLTLHSLGITCFMLECKSLALQDKELTSPTAPTSTLSDAPTLLSQLTIASDTTVVPPALVSPFEAKHYWHGISDDPPELLYRSDLESGNPFPRPEPGVRFSQLPVKTASGTWGTAMNDQVWREVAPLIVALFKERRIAYSALMSVRFSIEDEDGKKITGPLVVWVALHPGRNTASDARDVSPDVLNILVQHGVEGAVVEWYEGVVEKLTREWPEVPLQPPAQDPRCCHARTPRQPRLLRRCRKRHVRRR